MSKVNRIPDLLQLLVELPNISAACAAIGVQSSTFYRWVVRSRMGDAEFQEIEFCGVKAPLHVHLENAAKLSATAIEAAARDRSLNGTWTPATENGRPVYKKKDPKLIADMIELGIYDGDEFERDAQGQRIQERVWSRPTDQMAIKMLESHFTKKYGSRQEITVNHAHALILPRAGERSDVKAIEHQPEVFDEDDGAQEDTTALSIAAGRPATSAEEFEQWAKAGEFEHTAVEIDAGDGKVTTLKADLDPLQVQPHDSAIVRDLKERAKVPPKNPRPDTPVRVGKPEDNNEVPTPGEPPRRRVVIPMPMPKDRQIPAGRPRDGELIGAGPDPATAGGSQGFRMDAQEPFDARSRPRQRLSLTRPGRPTRTRGP